MSVNAKDEDGRPALNGILPWTKSCFVCGQDNPHGLHLRSRIEDGRVILDYTTREADLGYRHIVHGGIAMTLMDEVMTWAAIAAARKVCVAVEINTRLRRPIRQGQRIRVEGWVAELDPRLIRTEARILDEEGQVLLKSSGKYVPMPEDQLHLTEKDFIHHPDTIPPRAIMGRNSAR